LQDRSAPPGMAASAGSRWPCLCCLRLFHSQGAWPRTPASATLLPRTRASLVVAEAEPPTAARRCRDPFPADGADAHPRRHAVLLVAQAQPARILQRVPYATLNCGVFSSVANSDQFPNGQTLDPSVTAVTRVMADTARIESSGGARRGAASIGPPPSKKAGSSTPAAVAQSAPQLVSHSGTGTGRHAAARTGAKEVLARSQMTQRGKPPPIFQFPPAFEEAVARQVQVRHAVYAVLRVGTLTRGALQFFKRIFSPAVLTEPLPPALRLSLTRNFSFFTRIFTQFFGKSTALRCARVTLRCADSLALSFLYRSAPTTRSSSSDPGSEQAAMS